MAPSAGCWWTTPLPHAPACTRGVTDGNVMYVGMASQLRQVAHGTRMDSAYNAYADIPAPKVVQINSPRVRVNGLLNRSIVAGATVMLWWLETATAIRQCAACPANAVECNLMLRAPRSRRRRCVIGRARTARSDVDRVFGTGACCRRAGVQVRCALPVVRQTSRCLPDRRNARYACPGAVSTGGRLSPVGLLPRLVAGLGN
jgi:hypothetical protein